MDVKMKKYEFTGETKMFAGKELKRIVAAKDFDSIKIGDIGGWIQNEENLSHRGNCWVKDEAIVCESARVCDDAWVRDMAIVSGCATLDDNVMVMDKATVKGGAVLRNNASVSGIGSISGNAWVVDKVSVIGNVTIKGNGFIGGSACLHGNGEVLTKKATTICAPHCQITITDTHITIGRQSERKSFWVNAGRDDVLKIDGEKPAEMWEKYKSFILDLAK